MMCQMMGRSPMGIIGLATWVARGKWANTYRPRQIIPGPVRAASALLRSIIGGASLHVWLVLAQASSASPLSRYLRPGFALAVQRVKEGAVSVAREVPRMLAFVARL